jgi:hypothetical protein
MTAQLGGAGLSTLSWTCYSEVQRHSFECRRAVDIPSPLQDCEHLLDGRYQLDRQAAGAGGEVGVDYTCRVKMACQVGVH